MIEINLRTTNPDRHSIREALLEMKKTSTDAERLKEIELALIAVDLPAPPSIPRRGSTRAYSGDRIILNE